MHIPTHILSGWCVGNLLPLTPRQRLCCMVAVTACDLDGVSFLVGQEAYWDYHHALGHNVFATVAIAGVLAAVSPPRRMARFLVYLALAHLHLLMDYYGSGPQWPIYYLWPVSRWRLRNPSGWEFFSWQNLVVAGVLFLWTVWIAYRYGRTPLELIAPRMDGALVGASRRMGRTDDH